MKKSLFKRVVNALIIISLLVVTSSFGNQAKAAVITSLSDNLSRLKISTLANHTIEFVTPTGITANQTITLTFDADFTMGTFALVNFDLAVAATCTGFTDKTLAASPTTTVWGVGQTGQVVTFTAGSTETVTAGYCIQIEIGANATSGGAGALQITNPSGAQTATLAIGGTMADAGNAGIAIITDDQVSVTATVDPTLSFAISDTTIGFGDLSASDDRFATGDLVGNSAATVGHTITASTNGASGYTVYGLGATLTSAANTITSLGNTSTASSVGTEQFGINVSASGGSGTASAPYATASQYAHNTISAQDEIASASAPSATTTYSLTYLGNITVTTEAGSYTTTMTYTATAGF